MTLSATSLNRTLLARQLLLDPDAAPDRPRARARRRSPGAVRAVAVRPALVDARRLLRDDLTRALERRRAVQGTLMRSTIHLVSARDYWRFEAGIGPSRREWWLRTWGRHELAENVDFVARELEGRLAGRTWHRKEIDALRSEKSAPGWSGMWIPLVRVPPSGTWERRRADLFRLAGEWLPASASRRTRGSSTCSAATWPRSGRPP